MRACSKCFQVTHSAWMSSCMAERAASWQTETTCIIKQERRDKTTTTSWTAFKPQPAYTHTHTHTHTRTKRRHLHTVNNCQGLPCFCGVIMGIVYTPNSPIIYKLWILLGSTLGSLHVYLTTKYTRTFLKNVQTFFFIPYKRYPKFNYIIRMLKVAIV